MSTAGIARLLNERGIASPGMYDQDRNPHRHETVWTLRTVAAILANPRYTGRQVWNRQFTDHREAVPGDRRSSQGPVRVWNPRSDWVTSTELTHPALVSDADFLAVQQITAIAVPTDDRVHRYQLTGLLVCGLCGRRLEGHWVNQRPGYRCRHGHTTAHPADVATPPRVYWAQARIMEQLLITADREPAIFADAGQLASHLRTRDAVIVCGLDRVEIDEPAVDDAEPSRRLAHEVPADGQLVLPIPLSSFTPQDPRARRSGHPR